MVPSVVMVLTLPLLHFVRRLCQAQDHNTNVQNCQGFGLTQLWLGGKGPRLAQDHYTEVIHW